MKLGAHWLTFLWAVLRLKVFTLGLNTLPSWLCCIGNPWWRRSATGNPSKAGFCCTRHVFKQTPRAMVTGKQQQQQKTLLAAECQASDFHMWPRPGTLLVSPHSDSYGCGNVIHCLLGCPCGLAVTSFWGGKIADWKEVECPVFTVHANLAPLSKCLQFLVLCRMEVHS